jgi:hypothetical protein
VIDPPTTWHGVATNEEPTAKRKSNENHKCGTTWKLARFIHFSLNMAERNRKFASKKYAIEKAANSYAFAFRVCRKSIDRRQS